MPTNVKYTDSARYKCLEYLKKASMDLYLCYCGSQICCAGHAYGPEIRKEYLIHIVLKGRGYYTVGSKTYEIGPDTAFLILPGATTYYEASTDDPWTYIWVGFNGIKAEAALKHAHFSKDNLIVPIKNTEPFVTCVNGMLASSQLTFSNDFAREGYLYQFISYLVQNQQNLENSEEVHDYSYQVYVEHTLEYIEHNFSGNLKVQSIADYIGINRSYLTNCFKNVLNMSPQEYILNYRMNQASILLKNTMLPVGEIAYKVGYDDALNFSKAFKKIYGINPTKYRSTTESLDISDKDTQNRL
ncbi:AraC family transcriptional regulator [Anaerocolumna sp. AGMB13020]|uniref:AraC family transcriptional regulator n=1 Tax=Anaerocolumna sp. AGMB13020 TaxID=3081750 RepID=UPI002955B7E5|nr:AraC family transcriptional regulator [Anaerocolumna sp. AGMB13020]WOO38237.1 AraC family transcriptional regulator [Anaerocolumna sp. AGMB13020]